MIIKFVQVYCYYQDSCSGNYVIKLYKSLHWVWLAATARACATMPPFEESRTDNP